MMNAGPQEQHPHGNFRNSIADVVIFAAVVALFFLSIGVGFA